MDSLGGESPSSGPSGISRSSECDSKLSDLVGLSSLNKNDWSLLGSSVGVSNVTVVSVGADLVSILVGGVVWCCGGWKDWSGGLVCGSGWWSSRGVSVCIGSGSLVLSLGVICISVTSDSVCDSGSGCEGSVGGRTSN